MTTLTVKITGVAELKRALDGNFNAAMQSATLGIANEIKGVIAPYPAAPIPANPRRWYERKFGPKWMSDPARRPQKRRGSRPIVYGPWWAGYRTSETMSQRWAVASRGLGAITGNTASYAPVVHHYKEQATVHERTGWVTDKEAVERVVRSGTVDRIVKWAVDKKLRGK
jgi:hypothetical protein